MTHRCARTVALVGMACCFPSANDLAAFWQVLVRDADSRMSPRHTQITDADPVASTPETIGLGNLIHDALKDSEGPDGPLGSMRNIVIITSHDAETRSVEAIGCGAFRSIVEPHNLVDVRDVDPSAEQFLKALKKGVQDLQEGFCDSLVVAADEAQGTRASEAHARVGGGRALSPSSEQQTSQWQGVALVLIRMSDVPVRNSQPYAFLKEVGLNEQIREMYARVNADPDRVSFLDVLGPFSAVDTTSQHAAPLAQLFGHRTNKRNIRPAGTSFTGSEPRALHLLTSVIKAALSLSNKVLPPSWPDEKVQVPENLPFYPLAELSPWIHASSEGPRLAALHIPMVDPGVGHLLLEEVTREETSGSILPRPIKTNIPWESELVVFSAASREELGSDITQLLRFLQSPDGSATALSDLAYTQTRRFDHMKPCRLAMVCTDREELQKLLEECRDRLQANIPNFADSKGIYWTANGCQCPGRVACVFPGLGFPGLLGPYTEHLHDLCLRFPEVREVFDLIDRRDDHPDDPIPSQQIFFPPKAYSESDRQRLRQRLASPRLTDAPRMDKPSERNLSSFGVSVANWASWKLLEQLRLPVDMVFGQSYGEMSALCAAGVVRFPDLIKVHWEAGFEAQYIEGRGRLALVQASQEQLHPYLSLYEDVTIAVHVAPLGQILGGEESQLEDLVRKVRESGIWVQVLPYPAIHTPRYTSLRTTFQPYLETIPVYPARMPVYSGMSTEVYPAENEVVRRMMIDNLDHSVRLWQTTRKMYAEGARVFVQAGGGANMYSHARTNIDADNVVAVPLDVDYRSALTQLNHLCATLITSGVPIDLSYLYRYRSTRVIDTGTLPSPPAERENSMPDSAQIPASFRDDADQGDTPQERDFSFPFIGDVLHYKEHEEILVRRTLNLREDLWLGDHLFIHAPGIKPVSSCLPVVPMTVSMEILAETAASVAPGYGLLGMEDVKASRWIDLVDSETLEIQASARMFERDPRADVLKITAGIFLPNRQAPVIQGVVVLGRQYVESLVPNFSQPKEACSYPLSAERIYAERHLFHGPIFQCLGDTPILADRHVFGELLVPPKERMFRSRRQREFLTDPIVLDGVGQLIGLWAIRHDVSVFPVLLTKLELYGPTPPVGTTVPVCAEITEFGSKFLNANVEIQDGTGNVWMRIQGWGNWVFRWPKRFLAFTWNPFTGCVSQDLSLSDGSLGAMAQLITTQDIRDLDLHGLARYYLHLTEMETFAQLGDVPKRQTEWLLGRVAAKDAARRWLASQTNADMVHPATLRIEQNSQGQPVIGEMPGLTKRPFLSIAHSNGQAMALAHVLPVGVDMEPVEPREPGFLDTITSDRERTYLATIPDMHDPTWATRIWCAKEAAGKALGTGIGPTPHSLEVIEVRGDGTVCILDRRTESQLAVKTRQEQGFVLAYTTNPQAAPATQHARAERS